MLKSGKIENARVSQRRRGRLGVKNILKNIIFEFNLIKTQKENN